MAYDMIREALAKGVAMTREDLRAIELEIAMMPADEGHEVEEWVREGVWLIVAAPDYEGDIQPAD